MTLTNNKPDFSTIWDSIRRREKTKLKTDFCKVAGINTDMMFFRKKKANDWTELEKQWWANRLKMSKEQLFPEPAFFENSSTN